MTARLLLISCLLTLGGLFLSKAAAQTPADISYGSLAAANNPLLSTATPQPHLPIYVAQSTAPAPITLNPNTPSAPPPANPSIGLPHFDPYAAPSQAPLFGSILPSNTGASGLGQAAPSNIYSGNFDRFVPETYAAMRRFRDAASFEYTHLPRNGGTDSFGMDLIDMRMQLAIPCRFIPDNGRPGNLYVAPGGNLVWWNGPAGMPGMSPNGFGAFLDFGVQPKFNDAFTLNTWGRFGVFSDFQNVTSDAFRFQGRIEGIYTASPQMRFHAGMIYYGRARLKMLPAVGVVWTPNDDWVVKLVFPNPKVSRRLWQSESQTEWWGYIHMDYAGGSWDIKGHGLTDYNDLRLGVGVEFAAVSRLGGYFEFGGSFARELYSGGHRWAEPPAALYLKTGIIF